MLQRALNWQPGVADTKRIMLNVRMRDVFITGRWIGIECNDAKTCSRKFTPIELDLKSPKSDTFQDDVLGRHTERTLKFAPSHIIEFCVQR